MDGPDLTTPLTCTLSAPSQRAERKRFRRSLLPHVTGREILPDGMRISFDARSLDRIELDHLVQLDKGCCSFLTHRVEEKGDTITLTTTAEGDGIVQAQAFADEFELRDGGDPGKDKDRDKDRGKAAMIGLASLGGLACIGSLALAVTGTGALALTIGGLSEIVLLGLAGLAAIVFIRHRRASGKDAHADRGCC